MLKYLHSLIKVYILYIYIKNKVYTCKGEGNYEYFIISVFR
ncbi:hypothetical protein SAMN04488542_101255 [Fontibacillus panacisegetis]|uniref:Uncharacterized protein n=1 Tax=Fontibacillus panacisegetis TaxID=670482 RepID=A0A1G7EKY1_9BACL|nr:hypothetical protein SAMN04488542_101255 [Fontibacillus panacisegetis]